MKKSVFLPIITICIALCLSGCAKKNDSEEKNNPPAQLPDAPQKVVVDIDSMKKSAVEALNGLASIDLSSGTGITIASSSDKVYVPDAATSNYNKTLIERNNLFEKKYSTSLNQFFDSEEVILNRAYTDMLAGVYYADFFSIPQNRIPAYASKGVLLKRTAFAHSDFSAPYFDINAINRASGGFDSYAVYGEFTRDIGNVYCLYINRDILSAAGLSMPYDKVRDGTWTWDDAISLVRACASLDGNAAIASHDLGELCAAVYKSSGSDFINGGFMTIPSVAYGNENAVRAIDLLRSLTTQGRAVYDATSENSNAILDFMQGKSLFCLARVKDMKTITTMANDWCVLPLPKTDINQDNYYSYIDKEAPVIVCSAGIADTEKAYSALCGLNAASSGGYLSAAYYYELIDTSIRDSSALDMMDYICGIKAGIMINDFTDVYGDANPKIIDNTKAKLAAAVSNHSLDVYSLAESASNSLSGKMSQIFKIVY